MWLNMALSNDRKKKETRDKIKVCAVVLTDLSKSIGSLLHDFLISK